MKKYIFLLLLILGLHVLPKYPVSYDHFKLMVHAEDDEDEEDHEEDEEDDEDEEDEDDHDDDYEYVQTPVKTQEPVTEYIPETVQNVWVPAVGYDIDSDGDLLVDAIDPHPTIDERKLFTDSDGDTVADAYDMYDGSDDFLYVIDADENNNGILDSYEP